MALAVFRGIKSIKYGCMPFFTLIMGGAWAYSRIFASYTCELLYFIKSLFKYLNLFKYFHNALTSIRIKYILNIKM